jgi:rfaE bifunctional protein kinase chain/domain
VKRTRHRYAEMVGTFKGLAVGVLGDYMLDELVRGEATRISPEAPVPVVVLKDRKSAQGFPGGAGNVAANLAALGARAVPFGAIGDDESGKRLKALLKQREIQPDTLQIEPHRITPHKVRIVAHQQQLLRLDTENPRNISMSTSQALARSFARWVHKLKALIISDYRKGTVTTELSDRFKTLARERKLPVFVDPKPEHAEVCRHATVITPNLHEAELMAGFAMRDRAQLEKGGRVLLERLECSNVLITRGADGMTLFDEKGGIHEIPSVPCPVYDVTGAGDTVLAVLALAHTGGATLREAAELANIAGGRVVLKFGTAEISTAELIEAVQGGS